MTSRLGIPKSFGFTSSPGNYEAGIWERSGVTPGGQPWTMKTRNNRDCEDDDTDWTFTIGELTFHCGEDNGRDYASSSASVRHESSKAKFCTSEGRGRDGTSESERDTMKDEMQSLLMAAAAQESMTPKDFAAALPSKFAGFLVNNSLV